MDIRIKGEMDGAETARILRDRFDIPVVYLTAHADRETLEHAKQSRPLGYVVKPFHESELHASVEIALAKHSDDRSLLSRERHVTDVLGGFCTAIICFNQEEAILMMNPAGENLTGWSKQEVLGQPARQVFRLADQDLPLGEALRQRTLVEIRDGLLITKSGVQKPVSGNIAPLRNSSGGPGGAVIMFEAAAGGLEDRHLASKALLEGKGNAIEFGRFHIVAASEPMKQVLSFSVRAWRAARLLPCY